MSSDGFSFTVLIGCDSGFFCGFREGFEFRDNSLFIRRNDIFWEKSVFNIDSHSFGREIYGMSVGCFDFIVWT
jgi:hypothetical protein